MGHGFIPQSPGLEARLLSLLLAQQAQPREQSLWRGGGRWGAMGVARTSGHGDRGVQREAVPGTGLSFSPERGAAHFRKATWSRCSPTCHTTNFNKCVFP